MTRQSAVAAVAAVLMAAGLAQAENLVSGPQVGDGVPGEFRVLFLNGDHAGKPRSCNAGDRCPHFVPTGAGRNDRSTRSECSKCFCGLPF